MKYEDITLLLTLLAFLAIYGPVWYHGYKYEKRIRQYHELKKQGYTEQEIREYTTAV